MSDKVIFSRDENGNPVGAIDIGAIQAIPSRILAAAFHCPKWDERWDVVEAISKAAPNCGDDPDLTVTALISALAEAVELLGYMAVAVDEASGLDSKAKLREVYLLVESEAV